MEGINSEEENNFSLFINEREIIFNEGEGSEGNEMETSETEVKNANSYFKFEYENNIANKFFKTWEEVESAMRSFSGTNFC